MYFRIISHPLINIQSVKVFEENKQEKMFLIIKQKTYLNRKIYVQVLY